MSGVERETKREKKLNNEEREFQFSDEGKQQSWNLCVLSQTIRGCLWNSDNNCGRVQRGLINSLPPGMFSLFLHSTNEQKKKNLKKKN